MSTSVSIGLQATTVEVGDPQDIAMSFFSSAAGTTASSISPVDPATITVTSINPLGANLPTPLTLAGGQVVKDSAGNYHVTITPDKAGLWRGTVTTTTPATASSYEFQAIPQRST